MLFKKIYITTDTQNPSGHTMHREGFFDEKERETHGLCVGEGDRVHRSAAAHGGVGAACTEKNICRRLEAGSARIRCGAGSAREDLGQIDKAVLIDGDAKTDLCIDGGQDVFSVSGRREKGGLRLFDGGMVRDVFAGGTVSVAK